MTDVRSDRLPSSRLSWLKLLLSGLMALVLALSLTRPAAAGDTTREAQLDALMKGLLFTEVVQVLSDEGRDMVDDYAEAGYGIPKRAWKEMITKLYDPAVMTRAFRAELAEALEGADLSPMVAFYESDLGQRIARLELDTRKMLSDETAKTAASDAWAALDPAARRAELIEQYVSANDLVEMNVVGALNSDVAYYQGLWQSSASDEAMSDSDLMREIWSSEAEVRASVSEWVYGFSTLAYDSLSDEELARYVAFSKSDAGQKLNYALFAAFDGVYEQLSRGLGAGTASLMNVFDGQQL
nr:DUF2059 domain-containing protein [uncultured Celeribacter sp.]